MDEGGSFVVNMFANTGDLQNYVDVGGTSRMIATEDYDYLIRMGVSPRLLSDLMYRVSAREGSTGYCMTAPELARYNVTTGASRPALRRR